MQNCEQKFLKYSSLLDYTYPGLNPLIWLQDGTLNPVHKDFVLKLLNSFYKSYDLKAPDQWVIDITVIGSLTTNKYLLNRSDFDCHVIVDIDKFIETNMPKVSKEEAVLYLDDARKTWDRAKILMPFTTGIVLELYFETPENPSNTENTGRYSMFQSKWLKDPIYFAQNLDFEESRKQAIEGAKALASELDISFGEIGRQIQRVDELKAVLQAWPKEKRQLYYDKIQKKLDDIEEEIEKSIQIKQNLVDIRHEKQDAFSENEIQFKFLARFHYFAILQNLKELLESTGGEVTVEELPLIEKIVSEANLTPKEEKTILVDFDGTLVTENSDGSIGNLIEGSKEALQKLKELGNIVEIYSCRANTEKGLDEVKQWLDNNKVPYDSIFVGEKPCSRLIIDNSAIKFDNWDNVLKQVEKSEKKASLYITASAHYWIDPSGKVYSVKDTHEDWLFENKDLLQKQYGYVEDTAGQSWWDIKTENLLRQLLQDGWLRVGDLFNISGEGSNYGKHFLGQGIEIADINRAPDSLFNFISNFGPDKYFLIEDLRRRHVEVSVEELMADRQEAINRALQRKNMVHASFNLPTIDPKSFKRTEPYALFIGTQNYGKGVLVDLFDVFGQHPMITEHNQMPTVTLETLQKENIPVIGKEPRAGDKQPAQDISSVYKTSRLFSKKEIIAGNVLDVNGVRVFKNPTLDQAIKLLGKSDENELRGLLDDFTNDLYLWDAYKLTHNEVRDALGIEEPMRKGEMLYEWGAIDKNKINFIFNLQNKKIKEKSQPSFSLKQAQIESNYDYSSTQFNLPKELSEKIIRWAVETIPEEQLFYDEDPTTHGIQLESHITLKYGLLTDSFEEIEQALKGEKAPKIKFGKISFFEPEGKDYDVIIIQVESEDLERLNKKLCDSVKHEDLQGNEYHPHVTVCYIKRGLGKEYSDKDILSGEEITLDILTFSPKMGDKQSLELGKNKKDASGNNFLPSLIQAPNNEWQFQSGGSDLEIGVDPDPISDESTWYSPCTEGKPRSKEVWRSFISIFDHPISKKDTEKVSSIKQAGEAQEWDSHYGDIWHVGDKVKDKQTGKIGIIKSINGTEVELEEVSHE